VILDELARASAQDEGEFVRRFPNPALIFLSAAAPPPDAPKVDTPSGGTSLRGDASFARTSALKATDKFPIGDAILEMGSHDDDTPVREIGANAPVVFLVKSGRNPFESMITIGRATNNDHCIPLPTISKVHAYFSASPGGGWRIHDQRATNGTFVDHRRLEAGGNALLQDGSRIGFGPDVRARFYTSAGLFGFVALFRKGLAT
jgi:hypothetical protein